MSHDGALESFGDGGCPLVRPQEPQPGKVVTASPRKAIRRISEKRLRALGGRAYSTISAPKKAVRKKPRSKSEFQRIYGSKERVLFVKGLPCCTCGVVGFSENAHVPPKGEAGTGYKADYRFIAPLCGERPITFGPFPIAPYSTRFIGCHEQYDRYRWAFDKRFPDIDLEKCAEATEKLWQSRISEREE